MTDGGDSSHCDVKGGIVPEVTGFDNLHPFAKVIFKGEKVRTRSTLSAEELIAFSKTDSLFFALALYQRHMSSFPLWKHFCKEMRELLLARPAQAAGL